MVDDPRQSECPSAALVVHLSPRACVVAQVGGAPISCNWTELIWREITVVRHVLRHMATKLIIAPAIIAFVSQFRLREIIRRGVGSAGYLLNNIM